MDLQKFGRSLLFILGLMIATVGLKMVLRLVLPQIEALSPAAGEAVAFVIDN